MLWPSVTLCHNGGGDGDTFDNVTRKSLEFDDLIKSFWHGYQDPSTGDIRYSNLSKESEPICRLKLFFPIAPTEMLQRLTFPTRISSRGISSRMWAHSSDIKLTLYVYIYTLSKTVWALSYWTLCWTFMFQPDDFRLMGCITYNPPGSSSVGFHHMVRGRSKYSTT